jgi:hydrogenase maturation protease
MKLLGPNMRVALADLLAGRVCVVGVGNRGRGDDAAGPRVIDARGDATRGVWIDAGMAPENFLEPIARSNPDTVLIVDAVTFGGSPGQCCLMNAEATDTPALSTHCGSLAMLGSYLSARTGAQIRVLGIQPECTDVRDGLSHPVGEAVDEVAAMLSELLGSVRN